MFSRTAPDTEPVDNDVLVVQLIPLSHLELDHPAPVEGWNAFLGRKGVEICNDGIGRPSIASDDARRLLTERAEAEERRAELLRQADEQAAAFDREWRRSIGAGISPDAYAGMSYVEAARESELDNLGYQPRASVVADAFADPDSITFHPLTGEPAEG